MIWHLAINEIMSRVFFWIGILSSVAFVAVVFIAYKTNQEDPDNEEYP